MSVRDEQTSASLRFLLVGYSLYAWTVALAIGLCGFVLVFILPSVRTRRQAVKQLARLGLYLCRIRCEGNNVHIISSLETQVLVSNHTSFLDVVVYTALLPIHVTFIAKKELESAFLIGRFLKRIKTIFVERANPRRGRKDLRYIERFVDRGNSVLFFPEGTFTPEPGLRKFKIGAFRVAATTRTAVVPIAIRGARRIFRDTNPLLRPGLVVVEVSEPIFLYKFDSTARERAANLRKYARQVILPATGEGEATIVEESLPETCTIPEKTT